MGKIVINDFKGINSSLASLQLKPGEFSSSQNLRSRPYSNFSKRKGVETSSIQTTPVMGIFELELDGVVIPIIQSSSILTYSADISSPSFPIPSDGTGIYGLPSPLDPSGLYLRSFLIEPSMRAIQERRVVPGHAVVAWPNVFFNSSGGLLNGGTGNAVSSYPVDNLYGPDLNFHDQYFGNPIGTRAAVLVNALISACRTTVGFGDYIQSIANQTSITIYGAGLFPALSSATTSNYRTQLANCQVGIRVLTTIKKQGTQVNVESKSGTAQDSSYFSCNDSYSDVCSFSLPTSLQISGWTQTMFQAPGQGGSNSDPCYLDVLSPIDFWTGNFDGDGTGYYNMHPQFGSVTYIKYYNTITSSVKTFLGFGTICYDASTSCSGPTWYLSIYNQGWVPMVQDNYILWLGKKIGGVSASGSYSQIGGCATSPGTVTIS